MPFPVLQQHPHHRDQLLPTGYDCLQDLPYGGRSDDVLQHGDSGQLGHLDQGLWIGDSVVSYGKEYLGLQKALLRQCTNLPGAACSKNPRSDTALWQSRAT